MYEVIVRFWISRNATRVRSCIVLLVLGCCAPTFQWALFPEDVFDPCQSKQSARIEYIFTELNLVNRWRNRLKNTLQWSSLCINSSVMVSVLNPDPEIAKLNHTLGSLNIQFGINHYFTASTLSRKQYQPRANSLQCRIQMVQVA